MRRPRPPVSTRDVRHSVAVHVEGDAARSIRQIEAVARRIYDNGRAVTEVAAAIHGVADAVASRRVNSAGIALLDALSLSRKSPHLRLCSGRIL